MDTLKVIGYASEEDMDRGDPSVEFESGTDNKEEAKKRFTAHLVEVGFPVQITHIDFE